MGLAPVLFFAAVFSPAARGPAAADLMRRDTRGRRFQSVILCCVFLDRTSGGSEMGGWFRKNSRRVVSSSGEPSGKWRNFSEMRGKSREKRENFLRLTGKVESAGKQEHLTSILKILENQ